MRTNKKTWPPPTSSTQAVHATSRACRQAKQSRCHERTLGPTSSTQNEVGQRMTTPIPTGDDRTDAKDADDSAHRARAARVPRNGKQGSHRQQLVDGGLQTRLVVGEQRVAAHAEEQHLQKHGLVDAICIAQIASNAETRTRRSQRQIRKRQTNQGKESCTRPLLQLSAVGKQARRLVRRSRRHDRVRRGGSLPSIRRTNGLDASTTPMYRPSHTCHPHESHPTEPSGPKHGLLHPAADA